LYGKPFAFGASVVNSPIATPNDSLTLRLELSAGQSLNVVTQLLSEPRCDVKTEPSTLMVAPYSYPP
jgi:hypothetical protein